jgi:beta-barrel assembly-enhancing protease
MGYLSRSTIIFLVTALAASSGRAQSKRMPSDSDINLVGKRTVRGIANAFPIDHEINTGEFLSDEIARAFLIIDDPVATEYVNRLAGHLVENSDAKIPFKVQIMNTVHPNAIILPGGHLLISSSLVLLTDNEAELAGILAHCIAHSILSDETCNFPFLVYLPFSPMGLKGLRDAEFDADYFGLQYVYIAGFDPNCFIDFLDRVSRGSTKITLSKDRERPFLLARAKALRKEVADILPLRPFDVVSSSDYDTVRERLRQLKLPFRILKKSDEASPPRIRYTQNPDQTAHIN